MTGLTQDILVFLRNLIAGILQITSDEAKETRFFFFVIKPFSFSFTSLEITGKIPVSVA